MAAQENTMIRKAEPKDKSDVLKLHYMSGPNLHKYLWACDEQKVYKLLDRLYDTTDTFTSSDFFWVNEEDGIVKGAICLVPAKDKNQLERNIGGYMRDLMRIAGLASVIKIMLHSSLNRYLPKCNDDELYIQALAVYPEYRGRKVSSALLTHAFAHARQMNLPKVSLLAETQNEHAISIYKKYGFSITQTIELAPKYRKYELYGAHKMVAEV
jgi:ribosomal protein S18 acetylase RimI-like enzyme